MLARTFTQIILSGCANSVGMFERANAAWLNFSMQFVRNEKHRGRASYFAPPSIISFAAQALEPVFHTMDMCRVSDPPKTPP
jgi:hypothetical protein